METFRDANYRPSVGRTLDITGFPALVGILTTRDLEPLSRESIHTGILEVNSVP